MVISYLNLRVFIMIGNKFFRKKNHSFSNNTLSASDHKLLAMDLCVSPASQGWDNRAKDRRELEHDACRVCNRNFNVRLVPSEDIDGVAQWEDASFASTIINTSSKFGSSKRILRWPERIHYHGEFLFRARKERAARCLMKSLLFCSNSNAQSNAIWVALNDKRLSISQLMLSITAPNPKQFCHCDRAVVSHPIPQLTLSY